MRCAVLIAFVACTPQPPHYTQTVLVEHPCPCSAGILEQRPPPTPVATPSGYVQLMPIGSGSVQGQVKLRANQTPLEGANVIATSSHLPTTLIVLTDDKGYYKLSPLPAGDDYTITFYYADITVERSAIVHAGRVTPIFEELGPAALQLKTPFCVPSGELCDRLMKKRADRWY